MQFLVVNSEEYQSNAFLAHKVVDFRIVIAFIHPTEDEDRRFSHALERIPARVDIGGLGVVDELHSPHLSSFLESVLHSSEAAEPLTDELVGDPCDICRDTGSE